jgi:hypothetical protein
MMKLRQALEDLIAKIQGDKEASEAEAKSCPPPTSKNSPKTQSQKQEK